MSDKRVIACNYVVSTLAVMAPSKAYVTLTNRGNDHERIMVLVRGRNGRLIHKWESIARLGNFRVVTIPPERPLYDDERLYHRDRAEVEVAELRESLKRALGRYP